MTLLVGGTKSHLPSNNMTKQGFDQKDKTHHGAAADDVALSDDDDDDGL